ncbi:hypothetical protein BC829DRAFT_394443, partial [Chytridium lagenaria]
MMTKKPLTPFAPTSTASTSPSHPVYPPPVSHGLEVSHVPATTASRKSRPAVHPLIITFAMKLPRRQRHRLPPGLSLNRRPTRRCSLLGVGLCIIRLFNQRFVWVAPPPPRMSRPYVLRGSSGRKQETRHPRYPPPLKPLGQDQHHPQQTLRRVLVVDPPPPCSLKTPPSNVAITIAPPRQWDLGLADLSIRQTFASAGIEGDADDA